MENFLEKENLVEKAVSMVDRVSVESWEERASSMVKKVTFAEEQNQVFFIPEKGFYQPSSDKTWEAYQALLSITGCLLGASRQLLLSVTADEILAILKNPFFVEDEKRTKICRLLSVEMITDDIVTQLCLISHQIDDYNGDDGLFNKVSNVGFYQSKSGATWNAYKLLMGVVEQIVGFDQPRDVLKCAADEVLSMLKNDNIPKLDVKKEVIEAYFDNGPIPSYIFDQLVMIESQITDFPRDYDHDGSQFGTSSTSVPRYNMEVEQEVPMTPTNFWYSEDEQEAEEEFSLPQQKKQMVGEFKELKVGNVYIQDMITFSDDDQMVGDHEEEKIMGGSSSEADEQMVTDDEQAWVMVDSDSSSMSSGFLVDYSDSDDDVDDL